MPMHSKQSRRRHPAELKHKVLAACEEPGASVAAVAHAHGLNANLVHKWRRCRGTGPLSPTAGITPEKASHVLPPALLGAAALAPLAAAEVAAASQRPAAARTPTDAATAFVPVQLEPRAAPSDIRLELQRGAATVVVTWPAQEATAFGSWLREWLG